MDDRTRRRKLIQGSLAAPLVLTIGRAGANARTTFSACLNESAHQPEPVHAVVEEDEAFRITRDVYEIHRRDGQGGDNPRKPDDIGRRDGEKPTRSYNQGQGGWGSGNPGKAEDLYIMGWNDETLYRIDGSRLVPQQVGFGPVVRVRTKAHRQEGGYPRLPERQRRGGGHRTPAQRRRVDNETLLCVDRGHPGGRRTATVPLVGLTST
jgi:hypothetical protein